jgi:4-hydroxythreonine-4-phosphate dehydrogenase
VSRTQPIVAIATGDPAGIGPEISLKAALDPKVRTVCRPVVVSDPALLQRHADACGISVRLRVTERISNADWSGEAVNVLACPLPEMAGLPFGKTNAAAGRAALIFASRAIKAALAKEVDAVIAAPQNETSIAMAGIRFDGYPSFVARETGGHDDEVCMMLCFGQTKISHVTLHASVRDAIEEITRERVRRVIRITDLTLRRLGIAKPRIAVSGLNPHAGEGGLFGSEEAEIIRPAIEAFATVDFDIMGPFGADTMFQMKDIDAFVVMLHDQGHIAAKLVAPNAIVAMTLGTPILFSSVAHGSAHDIAGQGIADPAAMIEAALRLANARPYVDPRR